MIPLELRNKGYQILVDHLGEIDTIRFLQDFGWGHGDYTKERQITLQTMTREKFWQDIHRLRTSKTE
jgi:hypothetical protein